MKPVITVLFCLIYFARAISQDCNYFLIKEENKSVQMEILTIKNNSVEVVNDGNVISTVLTFGEGLNGDMVQKSVRDGMLIIQCKDGSLKIKKRTSAGAEKALPDMPVNELKEYDIRVNITGGSGIKKAFKITNYKTFAEDAGPVIDMFGGRIPVQPGDYLITTETKRSTGPQKQKGKIGFKKIDGWIVVPVFMIDGKEHRFVVDLAATATVIDKSILPANVDIKALESVAFNGEGETVNPAVMQGATGSVSDNSFLGRATITDCKMGDVLLGNLEVNVLSKLPSFLLDKSIKGILGSDVLKDFSAVTFTSLHADEGELLLGEQIMGNMTIMPMKTARGLYFTTGDIDGVPVQFVIDTGSRHTIVSDSFVKEHKIILSNRTARNISGIDGMKTGIETGTARSVSIGGNAFENVLLNIGQVSALTSIGLDEVALLGMDFLSRFESIRIDFKKGEWGYR